jgi:hypothetical protein
MIGDTSPNNGHPTLLCSAQIPQNQTSHTYRMLAEITQVALEIFKNIEEIILRR